MIKKLLIVLFSLSVVCQTAFGQSGSVGGALRGVNRLSGRSVPAGSFTHVTINDHIDGQNKNNNSNKVIFLEDALGSSSSGHGMWDWSDDEQIGLWIYLPMNIHFSNLVEAQLLYNYEK